MGLQDEIPFIENCLRKYGFDKGEICASAVENILDELNENGAKVSQEEIFWVIDRADANRSASLPNDRSIATEIMLHSNELRRAILDWFPRVHTRSQIDSVVKPAGSGQMQELWSARRRAVAVQLPVHQAWVKAAIGQGLDVQKDGALSLETLATLMDGLVAKLSLTRSYNL